jgi:hypothetical protein
MFQPVFAGLESVSSVVTRLETSMGFGLATGFVGLLKLVTAINYSAVAKSPSL